MTVPKHLAEASSKILIYLTQVLEIPEVPKDVDEESTEEMTFTAEELEALQPIDEGNLEPFIPNVIDGIRVSPRAQSKEIKEVIDLRRIGPNRQTFYLAKAIDGSYYWFYSPCTDRNWQLRKLIGDYRHKSRMEVMRRKTHGVKKLRSGRRVKM